MAKYVVEKGGRKEICNDTALLDAFLSSGYVLVDEKTTQKTLAENTAEEVKPERRGRRKTTIKEQ